MNNRKLIIAGVVGLVFCFAGYNLWSYFKEQQAIQIEEDRQTEERRIAREEERQRQEAERQAAIVEAERRAEEERLAGIAEEEARAAEREAERLAQEAERAEQERIEAETREQGRIERARQLRQIEGLRPDTVAQLGQLSAEYILDNPGEFRTQTFSAAQMGASSRDIKLMGEETTPLMLYAAVSPDIDVLKALIDIGLDVNAANKRGVTPLMMASAYSTPEAMRFLIGQGADISARAYIGNMNALHAAALLNPNPDTIAVLVQNGLPLEQETEDGQTALLLAASENRNLEIAERLAELGANTRATDAQGRNAQTLVQARIDGDGYEYVLITQTANERILRALR